MTGHPSPAFQGSLPEAGSLRAFANAWREICVESIFSTGQSARSSPHSRLTERAVSWLWIKRRWKG